VSGPLRHQPVTRKLSVGFGVRCRLAGAVTPIGAMARTDPVAGIGAIGAVIDQISATQIVVAAAVAQQTPTTDEMGRYFAEVAGGSAEVSSNVAEVAEAAAETTEVASRTASAAGESDRVAYELQDSLAMFRH
jgi:methyl-accepting chemotaxis protein